MTNNIPKIQVLESDTDNLAVLVCDLTGTDMTGECLKDIIMSFIQVAHEEGEQELLKDKQYQFFCHKFGLSRNEKTRAGYEKLKATNISDVNLFGRVREAFKREREVLKVLLDACLLSKKELMDLRGFGETCLAQLEGRVSEISGLILTWESASASSVSLTERMCLQGSCLDDYAI